MPRHKFFVPCTSRCSALGEFLRGGDSDVREEYEDAAERRHDPRWWSSQCRGQCGLAKMGRFHAYLLRWKDQEEEPEEEEEAAEDFRDQSLPLSRTECARSTLTAPWKTFLQMPISWVLCSWELRRMEKFAQSFLQLQYRPRAVRVRNAGRCPLRATCLVPGFAWVAKTRILLGKTSRKMSPYPLLLEVGITKRGEACTVHASAELQEQEVCLEEVSKGLRQQHSRRHGLDWE